ncbi:MAG: energy transducer TonB [Bacteroidales bacterium]|nr:energy transducer TonB [Bacteroidales bacterium]
MIIRRLLPFLFGLIIPVGMQAQNVTFHAVDRHRVLDDQKAFFLLDSDTVHVDRYPYYAAGYDALFAHLYKYINYPDEAYQKNRGSKVEARFSIDTKGKAAVVDIASGPSEMFRKRVEMAIRNMGLWIPAVVNGQPFKMTAKITVLFTIEEGDNEASTSFFSLTMENLDAANRQLQNANQSNQIPVVRVYMPFSFRPYWSDGEAALQELANTDMGYPEKALKKGEKGLVNASFLVSSTGEVSEIKVNAEEKASDLEKAVRSFIRKHKKWQPGCEYGIRGAGYAHLTFLFDPATKRIEVKVL